MRRSRQRKCRSHSGNRWPQASAAVYLSGAVQTWAVWPLGRDYNLFAGMIDGSRIFLRVIIIDAVGGIREERVLSPGC